MDKATDFECLRTQVERHTVDEGMATAMRERLAGHKKSIYTGVRGSGKSTALICMVNLIGSELNEPCVYNSEVSKV